MAKKWLGMLVMMLVFGVVGVEIAQAQQSEWDVTVWGVLDGEHITEVFRVTARNANAAQNEARSQLRSKYRGIQQVGTGSAVSVQAMDEQSWWSVNVWGVLDGERIEENISVTARNANAAQNEARSQFRSRYRGIQQVGTGSALQL
ncbi:MAG: hypothetical protein LBP88_04795 [Treponema sp.]|jgi:hypothetical protein|nr:hypothetical protein [Treponema sp.]